MDQTFTRTALLALTAFALPAWGQAHRSVLLGQVMDSSGAAVAGAEVRVIEKSTNAARTTVSNESGSYEVPGLFAGAYRIEGSREGFKKAVVDDVALASGRSLGVNLRLEVGEVRESVTVAAEKQFLDTANADVNTIIGLRKVLDLPIGQGPATYLFLLVPGADAASSAGRGGSGMDIQPLQRQGTSQTRFNGSPQGTTEYTLDGTPNTQRGNSLPGGGSSFNPSAEVVEEVRVQTSTFDASIGHTGGATVDLILKSGMNDFHGAALGFFRHPSWNANSWSGNRGGVPRPDFTYRRWGFSGGGPVAFTLEKNLVNADYPLNGGNSLFGLAAPQDNANYKALKAYSPNDIPKRFVASYVYELPFGAGKRFSLKGSMNSLLGNWRISGIYGYQNNTPLAFTTSLANPLFGGADPAQRGEWRAFPGAGFGQQLQSFQGQLHQPRFHDLTRGIHFRLCGLELQFPGFASYNEDMALAKSFRITERFRCEFRWEALNALNRVVWGNPATNVSAANFGKIAGQGNPPRVMQVGLKINY